jgi:hypothetical protein
VHAGLFTRQEIVELSSTGCTRPPAELYERVKFD